MSNIKQKINYVLVKKDTNVLCAIICLMHLVLAPFCFIERLDLLCKYHIHAAILYLITIILSKCVPSVFLFFFAYIETIIYSFLITIKFGDDAGSYILTLTLLAYLFMIVITAKNSSKYTVYPAIFTIILIFAIQIIDFKPVAVEQPLTPSFYLLHYCVYSGTSLLTIIFIAYVIQTKFYRFHEKTKVKTAHLHFSATHDALTKIYNRRRVSEIMNDYATKPEYADTIFATCIFDVDNFKKLNDSFGHDCGDAVLKTISNIILRALPEKTVFARWGGEEFLIIFAGNTEIAEETLEMIRSRVQDYSFIYFNKAIKLTITLGLSNPNRSVHFQQMLIEADKNLIKGKQSGKNCIVKGDAN